MQNFRKVADYVEIDDLVRQLQQSPHLWNLYDDRKAHEGSPHTQMDDIWVRFRPKEELLEPRNFGEPHFAVWYPCVSEIPAVKDLCHDIMYAVGADYLGGVLITRLPPGGMIAPHHDRGGWHAEYLNCKVYVPLWGDDCLNTCEGEELVMKPGEAWTFDNLKVHSVHNRSTTDRAVLIICMRVE